MHAWRVADRTPVLAATMGLALSGDGGLLASGGLDLDRQSVGDSHWEAPGQHRGPQWRGLGGGAEPGWAAGGDRWRGRGLAVWQTASGERLASLAGHADQIRGVALSGDGRLVASSSLDVVRLWETATGRQLTTLDGHTGVVMGVALSQAGHVVASGGHDGTARLWRAESGQRLAILEGHAGPVYRVALSADGRLLASAGHDGTVRLWDTDCF